MNEMNCNKCEDFVPDLLLGSDDAMARSAEHVAGCPGCAAELQELRATFDLLDTWTAPEPSPFFDTRLYARLREEQNTSSANLWDRVSQWFRPGANRGLRPAMAGALGVAMLLGGGTAATLLTRHASAPAVSSPTVNDLKIYDNNAQALDQIDMLEDADAADTPSS